MLVYSICYYYGRNNSKHIINHLNSFNKIKTMKEDIFILNVMVDSQDESIHNKVKDELSHFIENRSLEEAVKYIILTRNVYYSNREVYESNQKVYESNRKV